MLSAKPCSDDLNIEDQHQDEISTNHNHQDEISTNHNHQEDSDDSCPVTCICNCCGMTITYEPIKTFDLKLNVEISTELISTYQPIYGFNFLSNIWHPPQVIS